MNLLKPLVARLRSRAGVPLVPAGFLRSLLPLFMVAAGVTALVLMYGWRDQASYKPLFGAREKVNAADVMSVLDGAGIPYRLHPDSGQVLVPDRQLGPVRMLLASKGVVARLPAGLELMDRNDPLGVSQFVQDVRFRRGLEGELAQSIMTLDAIESARVHLSIAKSSSFVVNDGEKSSAAVVLALKPAHELGHEQIAAIINMVAGSVAGLDPQRVTLVDQAGDFLSARVDLSDGFDSVQGNDAAHSFQDQTRRNVHDLLAPVLGEANFKSSIAADVDNDRIKETHEQYGDAPKVTNEALREELDHDPLALGVPGSLSNRPVAVAAATDPTNPANTGAATSPDANISTAKKNASTRQYAYDRNITQIQRSRGRLRRLSVAVVLNNAVAPGGKGVWNAADLANIERILRSGLGIDSARGDSLVVSALPFPKAPLAAPWWQQRDNLVDGVSWLSTALAVLLGWLLVARPLLAIAKQRLAAPLPEQTAADPALAAPAASGSDKAPVTQVGQARATMPVGPLLENYDLPPSGSPVDVMVDHLRVLAAKEPERVAEVVKQWVQKNVRAE
jgi:flagellar M-ring protein FliF